MINELNNLISDNYKKEQIGGVYILEEHAEPDFPKTQIKCGCRILICKFDGHNFFPFFQNLAGAKTIADYLVFVPHKNEIYVFVVELSTTRIKSRQYEPTKNIVSLIESTYNRVNHTAVQFHCRYILLTKKAINKGLTKPGKHFVNEKANMQAGFTYNFSNYCY